MAKWFSDNYMKLNEDKSHLLTTKGVPPVVGQESIRVSKNVKLLGRPHITFRGYRPKKGCHFTNALISPINVAPFLTVNSAKD